MTSNEVDAARPAPDAPDPSDGPGRWRRFRSWLARTWARLQPGPRARRGVTWGALAAAGIVAVVFGIFFDPDLGRLDDPAGILAALLVATLAGLAVVLVAKLLLLLPRFLGWAGFGALGVLIFALMALELPVPLAIATGLAIVLAEACLGGALALLLGKENLRPAKRAALSLLALLALAANVWLIVFIFSRGDTGHLVKPRYPDPVKVAPLAAADPSQPGAYPVLDLTYGSGKDRWRPEFGGEADLKTAAVDATPFVEGNEGWAVGVRKWFWGFGFDAFPRNGRVWYPDGPGPFPLVLVVHGNHNMSDFSDPGYEWLGRLLASRGMIVVSVDENFFNGSWFSAIDEENDGRGWLLLKHLELWRDWNGAAGNPFHGKVDLGRIALIGHSRGGEAAGIAASFNRLPRYPDDGSVPLGFNFNIRAVVAIAPSDGQYKPAGKPAPVSGVSYLLLQGGHDADVSVFLGERLYHRLKFEEGRYDFKTIVYSYRANHGQFNTTWGDSDLPQPLTVLLARAALLAPEAQRKIGAVYISAFLEATLRGDPAYLGLFRDGRSARAWLPEDLYITRFEDSTFRALADAEEDVDLTTGALRGAKLEGSELALWKEKDLGFRLGEGTKKNQVIVLGWKRDPAAPEKTASYALRLPDQAPAGWKAPNAESLLVLSLADSGDEPPDPKGKNKAKEEDKSEATKKAEKEEAERKAKEREARDEQDKKEGKEPLDLSIELVAADGVKVRLPLSRFRALPIPLESRFTKLKSEKELYGDAWEPVLQTFELPLRAFAEAQPGFDPAALREIRLVFDRSPEGVVILDDVGFAEGFAEGPPR